MHCYLYLQEINDETECDNNRILKLYLDFGYDVIIFGKFFLDFVLIISIILELHLKYMNNKTENYEKYWEMKIYWYTFQKKKKKETCYKNLK